MKIPKQYGNKLLIGRDEWFSFKELSLPAIKAKIDTGAKTSAIHAFNIRQKNELVFFDVHPMQGDKKLTIHCQASIIDKRVVMSSNGHKEKRFVISSVLSIAGQSWQVELTLSNRDPLKYRLLIGREALGQKVLIDPALSCHQKSMTSKQALSFYQAS